MEIKPLFDRVLVKVQEFVDDTAEKSDIITPDVAKDVPETGVVVAVGQGRILPDGTLRPLALAPGDWVLFGKFAGQDVSILQGHALIREDEVLAVLG